MFLLIWNVFILGTTGKDTIESAGLWLDHTESLPFSQFLCQCRFLPILHYRIIIFVFIILILCYDLLAISWQTLFFFFFCFLVRCVVFAFRRDVQKLNPEVRKSSTSMHVIAFVCILSLIVVRYIVRQFFPRLSNISCLICLVLCSSQRMRSWCCSGQRFIIRFS